MNATRRLSHIQQTRATIEWTIDKEEEMGDLTAKLQTWYDRVWKEEDTSAIEEMLKPQCELEGLGKQTLIGCEQFTGFHQAILAKLSNINITIDKSMENDGWVSALCSLTAVAKHSGKPVVITGAVFACIEADQFTHAYDHWDFIGLWEQLGLLPENSFATALMGEKIA